jgi:hypothetical protein
MITGAFDISKLAIDATKSDKGAVESALTFQTTSLASDFGRALNRMLFGDGIGVVSKVRASGGSVGSGTAALEYPDANTDDGRTKDWYGTVNGDLSPLKYIGGSSQVLGIGSPGTNVGTVASTTGTSVVFVNAPAIAANDSVYIVDGSSGGAGSAEFTGGIRAALSSTTGTSTYLGLARDTQGWTPSFGSVSEALSLSRMEDAYLLAKEYSQAGDQYAIFVNRSLFKKYGDILTAMRRSVEQTDLLGGWTGLEFAAGAGKVGVFLDYDVPDGEVIILNLDTWTIAQVSDLDWLEDPNASALHRLQNTITYQAVMVWFANVICLCPAANAKETQKTD